MISYYEAPYSQRGNGFGGFFRGLAKFISPIANTVKKVVSNPTVRSIAKGAMKTGVGLVADAIEGKDMREQSKKALKEARSTISNTMRNAISSKRHIEEEDSYSDDEEEIKPVIKKRRIVTGKTIKKTGKRRTIFD